MNVLYVSNSGELAGGGEFSLLDLVTGLDRSRIHPLVVCPGPGALVARLQAAGVPVEIVPFPAWRNGRVVAIARSLRRLTGLLDGHRTTLVHANATWRAALYAGLAGRWRHVPVVWHVRVAGPEPWQDRLLGRLATRIVVNSDAVARRFDGTARGRVRRIYNGLDVGRFAPQAAPPAARRNLGLPEGAPVVGSVGRFVAFKSYHDLLSAAALVRDRQPGVHWVLVGDGELRGDLEAECRQLGLDGEVHFTGWQERIPEWLALFDLFVLPSRGEHFGRVLLEAMAMEKAVVATDAGGVPEIVVHGETGILVPPADPPALAAAVLDLLKDPEAAARLGRAGRRRVVAEFSLAAHLVAIEGLYASLVAPGEGLA